MIRIRLGEEWSDLMRRYGEAHRNPVNRALHMVGIPVIVASLPVALAVDLVIGGAMFAGGWVLQLLGHACEGVKPAFVEDWRFHVTGLLWWARKAGLLRFDS